MPYDMLITEAHRMEINIHKLAAFELGEHRLYTSASTCSISFTDQTRKPMKWNTIKRLEYLEKIHRLDGVILCLLGRQFQIQRTRLEIHGIRRSSGSDENLLVNIDIHAAHN
ncbi:hypothetical protein V1477_014338 [Vespula maculifrons]|uniref:Uncharacterized protein n=1 Tax=Vespula maculifrons TaxID=7453 RepID=A0ABD2BKR5_VESMC